LHHWHHRQRIAEDRDGGGGGLDQVSWQRARRKVQKDQLLHIFSSSRVQPGEAHAHRRVGTHHDDHRESQRLRCTSWFSHAIAHWQQIRLHAKRESGDAKERGDAREVWQLEQLLGRRRHPETRDPARRDDEQAKCDHGEANAGDDGQAGEVAQQRQRHEAAAT
jgi:hypothetical protein